MGTSQKSISAFIEAFPKVTAVEETLTKAVVNFRDLVLEFEQLHLENRNYRKIFHEQKEKLENQTCKSCDDLKKTIASKEQILKSLGSTLKMVAQTKDFSLMEAIFIEMYGEPIILTPPKSVSPQKEHNPNCEPPNTNEKKEETPSRSSKNKIEDVEVNDESVSEIEGTPTGRRSPIFQSRKPKSNLSLKDKKKCSSSWPTSENKTIKLIFPSTPNKSPSRLRQARLNYLKAKSCNVVDLTCSPVNSGGSSHNENNNIQCNVKKELIDNDETILPSPTSGPVPFPPLLLPWSSKSIAKDSPTKFKKPIITKFKTEEETSDRNIDQQVVVNQKRAQNHSNNPSNQLSSRCKSPMKREIISLDADETHYGDESISLLHHVRKTDARNSKLTCSPSKRPLAENVNIVNMKDNHNDESISILQKEPGTSKEAETNEDTVKRVKAPMDPVFKEPTVRKKAEKRALPGWSCDQCRIFYDELYKDDPAMLAQLMDECSKHRGRHNPARPKTPDGFWYPRWDVPDDTEEFNRRNNAV